jgi:hypothetical protein
MNKTIEYGGETYIVCQTQDDVDKHQSETARLAIDGDGEIRVRAANKVRVIRCGTFKAAGAKIKTIYINGATIETLDVRNSWIDAIHTPGATIETLDVRNSWIDAIHTIGATIERLDARRSWVGVIYTNDAKIKTLDANGASFVANARENYFCILAKARSYVPALIEALEAGRINGSVYAGECACLAGTPEQERGCDHNRIVFRDYHPPAERMFFAIGPGMTPDRNSVARQAVAWAREFMAQEST